MEDKAGLDGLAQAHLVRQQHPWGRTAGDLGGDIELMGDGADPGPHQAQHLGPRRRHAPQPGLVTQAEPGIAVEARAQQALTRPVNRQSGIDPGLGEPAGVAFRVLALVGEDAGLFLDRHDPQVLAAGDAHPLPGVEEDPAQGRVVLGIEAGLAGGGKEDAHLAAFDGRDQAQAEFGLGLAEPALARYKGGHGRVGSGRVRLGTGGLL